MARPPKNESQAATANGNISREDFVRARDSVVTGLATLQSAIQELSRAYIAHSNTILSGNPGTTQELLALSNPLTLNGLGLPRLSSPTAKSEGGRRRKKPKQPVDPNAPKRALTPFFLYMQTARPTIRTDLGPEASKGQVSAEGTRRWLEMPAQQKELWRKAYHTNRAKYQEQKAAYLAGLKNRNGVAAQLAAENGALAEEDDEDDDADTDPDNLAGPEDPALEEGDEEDEEDDEDVPPPPPSPKANKRRKSGGGDSTTGAGAAATSARPSIKETKILPPTTTTRTESSTKTKDKDSKPKKRERKSKGETDPEPEHVKSRGEEKERRSKRKRKSDAMEEEA